MVPMVIVAQIVHEVPSTSRSKATMGFTGVPHADGPLTHTYCPLCFKQVMESIWVEHDAVSCF
jgi:hypothetical protein